MNRYHWKTAGSVVLLAALMAAPAVQAGHESESYTSSTYADVVSSKPIYREVEISTPREECWKEKVAHRDNPHWGVTAQTVTGGLIGGAIANKTVNGSKRGAATALGALIGASIGANRAANQRDDAREYVTYEERCRTVQEHRTEQRLDGYDVSYRYGGQIYHTRMPYDPGRRMRVQVSVSPEGV